MKMRVKIDNQTFDVEIENLQERPIRATVAGETFEIWPEQAGSEVEETINTSAPIPCAEPAAPKAGPTADKTKTIFAPIPGIIIAINTREGDEVKFGQDLMVLEAMKMKNAIRATRAGKIAAIRVAVGDQVRHNQVLLEYAD